MDLRWLKGELGLSQQDPALHRRGRRTCISRARNSEGRPVRRTRDAASQARAREECGHRLARRAHRGCWGGGRAWHLQQQRQATLQARSRPRANSPHKAKPFALKDSISSPTACSSASSPMKTFPLAERRWVVYSALWQIPALATVVEAGSPVTHLIRDPASNRFAMHPAGVVHMSADDGRELFQ